MSEEMMRLPEDLQEMERMLGKLQPARIAAEGGLSRDQLMYDAGCAAARRAGRRRLWLWQGACGVLVLACAGLALFSAGRGTHDAGIAKTNMKAPTTGAHTLAVESTASARLPEQKPAADPGMMATLPKFLLPREGVRPPDARMYGALSESAGAMGTTGGGGAGVRCGPTLRRSEGLDGLPDWQQSVVVFGGNRS